MNKVLKVSLLVTLLSVSQINSMHKAFNNVIVKYAAVLALIIVGTYVAPEGIDVDTGAWR